VAIDAAGLDRQGREMLAEWAVAHCPVSDAIGRAVPLTVEVE
jgi:organic hydroperoxide reductase OsmC/OhrA